MADPRLTEEGASSSVRSSTWSTRARIRPASEPIDPILEAHANDDTLLYFPEGRYKLEQFRNYGGSNDHFDASLYRPLHNFGLLGAGSGKTYLVPRDGQGSDRYGSGYFDRLWFELRYGSDLFVQGFTFDYTAPNTGGRFQVIPEGGFVFRDVEVEGVNDTYFGPLLFWVTDPDAHGLVENVRLPDGGGEIPGGPVGMYVDRAHKGTITIRNCRVEGFPDNGLYASNVSAPGVVQVEGGYFANSNTAQVRLGSPGSYVKNAHVAVTETFGSEGYSPIDMRGIRVADGGGVEIKNCHVHMSADAFSDGAIVGNRRAGSFSVKNTQIQVDAPFSSWAVLGKENELDDAAVTLDNVVVTGDAAGGSTIRLKDRDGSSLGNVLIRQTGDDRDGLELTNTDTSIENAVIDVTGEAIVADDASQIETKHIRT